MRKTKYIDQQKRTTDIQLRGFSSIECLLSVASLAYAQVLPERPWRQRY
jgi:hypothetical protein